MFGSLGKKTNAEKQRNVLALLNDDRLTDAQKSAYCFDAGICDSCGIATHWVGPFKRRPYTNERVWNGICRGCHPEKIPRGAPTKQQAPWEQMQKFVVPPEELLKKTTTAFSTLQTSVTEGINTLNDNIKSKTENMHNSERQPQLGFQHLNVNVFGTKGASSKPNQNQGLPQLNVFGGQRKQQQEQQQRTAFSSLKSSFQTTGSASSTTSTKENQDNNTGLALVGESVKTPFGKGQVLDYREDDQVYVVGLRDAAATNEPPSANPKNTTKLFCKLDSFSVEHENKSRQKQSMELNEAYESLEKMRRLNLELECQERGVGVVDYNKCTVCLLNPHLEASQPQPQNFQRIRKLMKDQKSKMAPSCLFCASPSCPGHSCAAFRKEGITACLECVKLFESDYVVACINHAHGLSASELSTSEREGGEPAAETEERPLDRMIDLYDRVLLLLQYSSQYIESIAAALEQNTKNYNNVNMGSSSVGIVSGALGVAAAATIFTPAGPPLLIASLTLGGGATAVQTGTEAVNYFSEPNRFADKIIALVGMVHSLLRVKETLREILTARLLEREDDPNVDRLKKSLEGLRQKQREAAVKAGTTVASTAVLGGVAIAEVAASAATVESAALMTSVEVGTLAGRNANMLSKSGTAIARGARFARFAGGALSAATILLEAKTMSTTIQQIKAGHPCDKANTLRALLKEIPTLPTSEQLDEECRIYIGAMSNRVNATSLEDAINLIESNAIEQWQQTKAKVQEAEDSGELAPQGVSILDGDVADDDEESAWESVTGALSASLRAKSTTTPPRDDGPVGVEVPRQDVPLVVSSGSPRGTATDFDDVSVLSTATTTATPKMSQSMPQLPSDSASPSKQSALLERIRRFKQEESGSFGSSDADKCGAQLVAS